MRTTIQQRIEALGLSKRVRLITNAQDEDLAAYYQAADVFVMPTTKTSQDREGFGIVYLEAQLFSLPVVATNQPGVNEAVIDSETGLLIEDTPTALLAALERLQDVRLRSRLGQQGRQRVLAQFTREQQMSKLAALLSLR